MCWLVIWSKTWNSSETKMLGHFSFEAKKVTKTTLVAISANLRQKCVLDHSTERVQKLRSMSRREKYAVNT